MPSQTVKRTSKKIPTKKSKKSLTKITTEEMPLVGMVEQIHTDINREADHPNDHMVQKFQKRFVFVGSCSNCEHLPMSVGSLVALMFFLVATLSGIVLVQMDPSVLHSLAVSVSEKTHTIAQN